MQNFLIVVNNIRHGDVTMNGADIVTFLLSRRVWIFPDHAPIKRFQVGDRLIIYVGGRVHVFVAEARIASVPAPLSPPLLSDLERMGLGWFRWFVRLKNERHLKPPRSIISLIPKLDFVTDKKNYGLALRLGVRRIDDRDAARILGGSE